MKIKKADLKVCLQLLGERETRVYYYFILLY